MELLAKNGIKEQIVGWYATHPELNGYSALIQNYFSQETMPNQAIHLTVDTDLEADGKGLSVKGWVSSSLGLNPKPENCVFLPVPVQIKYADSERAGREYPCFFCCCFYCTDPPQLTSSPPTPPPPPPSLPSPRSRLRSSPSPSSSTSPLPTFTRSTPATPETSRSAASSSRASAAGPLPTTRASRTVSRTPSPSLTLPTLSVPRLSLPAGWLSFPRPRPKGVVKWHLLCLG